LPVILRFSAAVARYRRRILLTGLVLSAIAVTDAVRAPQEPAAALASVGTVAILALVGAVVMGAVFRRHIGRRFEVDELDRAFRTPLGGAPVLVCIFLLAGLMFFAEVGGWSWAHGDRDGGWLAVMMLLGAPTALFVALVWRGHGLTLTTDGIRADQGTGRVVIPWTALSPDQPPPVTPPEEFRVEVAVAHPEQITRSGVIRRPHRLTFEGTQPGFVAAAIRHYAAHPDARAMIGTESGHRRLSELLEVPPRADEPPPSGRHIGVLAAAGVLIVIGVVSVETWIDLRFGRHSAIGYASQVARGLLALLAYSLLADAVRGLGARRRQRHELRAHEDRHDGRGEAGPGDGGR
jgi:hypothetical protein